MKGKTKEEGKGGRYFKPESLVWAIRKLWGIHRPSVVIPFVQCVVEVALSLAGAYFVRVLIDSIGKGDSFERLALLALFFLTGITLLKVVKRYLEGRLESAITYPTRVVNTEMNAQDQYYTDYENTERQDYKRISGYAWEDNSHGNSSLENVAKDVGAFCRNALGIFTYASLMAALNPVILAVVIVTSLLSYFTTRWQSRYLEKNKHRWEKERRKKGYLETLSEDFTRAKDVKLYGMEGWLDRMMRDYQAYLLMWDKRCSRRGLWASAMAGVMSLIQNGVAYVLLIGSLLQGNLTAGEFVFYFGLTGSIAGYLQGLVGGLVKLSSRAEKIAYYRDMYHYPNRANHGEGCELPGGPVQIRLKDVWYRYDGAEDYTLKGIDLCIEAGESLALVGVNGAGKTTLVKLLCGLYTPTRGEILVGGRRIEEYNIEEYFSLISAVFQEIWQISFTVFEFVASVDPARPTAREDAVSAMRFAGIYEKIQGLENGMDTHLMKGIYDDGVELSGGEMQKLILARAIYKDGLILILDEPTAALDPIAENRLYLQYRELTKGRTSVYISHRFASTRFCDRIVLLEEGRIKESGTHEELMELNGSYAYMFGVQSKYYKEGEIYG